MIWKVIGAPWPGGNCWEGLGMTHTGWDEISIGLCSHPQKNTTGKTHQFGREYSWISCLVGGNVQHPFAEWRLVKTTSTHLTIPKSWSVIIFVWLRSEVAGFSFPIPPSLGASAHWPLPLVAHHQPTCSSDSQCYGQTASQWKMREHFLGFTNTVWNKSPYQTWGLFIVLIGGKINALCISIALFKQDKNYMCGSNAFGIEWIV